MTKYTLLLEENSNDGAAVLLDDKGIVCILENERVTKHKHSAFEKCDDTIINYVLDKFNLTREEVQIQDKSNTIYHSHHALHAAASYFSSGYDKASILVIDGYGDQDDSITLFTARNNEIYELKKYGKEYSLGTLYSVVSSGLYQTLFSEGKLMGLSCCAEPEYNIPSPIQFFEDGSVKFNMPITESRLEDNIEKYMEDKFGYLLTEANKVLTPDVYKAKIAATVQWWFTDQVINIVKYLKSLNPRSENLCICGGCFLNCETNGIIDRLGLFKNIYCVPAPADNSIMLGQAQQLLINANKQPQRITSAYWGPTKAKSFEELLDIFKIQKTDDGYFSTIPTVENICKYNEDWVIQKLEENKPILWFDGESEYGPRALGHRSFLANPATNEMFWKLSVDIKQRENYRPLAPITIDTLYPLIFEDEHPENLTQFMLKTVRVKPEWHNKLKAVVHVNQTARPQRLTEDVNPVLYSLIKKWYEKTGLPCLINTSLNLKNTPLVETYDDLKAMFLHAPLIKNASVVVDHALCFDI
jgi:carbamoyltransferase